MQSSQKQKLGRGTWLDKVAADVVERERRLGRGLALIRVESGLGASGIPHVGNASDAIRAYGVKLALEDMGYKSQLIAFSDDRDGLRKVPEGLPAWLNDHIAKPVSNIPDPFDCHASYGQHMTSMLLDALDRLSIEYKFQSGAEAYRTGLLNEPITIILENASRIGEKISEMLGQKKFEQVLPYYPICERCGRLYVAEATEYIKDEKKVIYVCRGAQVARRRLDGCGFEGEVDITSGKGKLSWKGEFAARWKALDIRFEAYGKDIADSVKLNDWISEEILEHPHPHHIRYELFLDKSGKKISKSLGNVFTAQSWLRYGSPQSLILLMFKRVAGTRNLSPDDIPSYMDEYDSLEDLYFDKRKETNPADERKLKGLYEYVNLLRPSPKPSAHIPYRLLVQIASVSPVEGKADYVLKRLKTYRAVGDADTEVEEKIKLAVNWVDDLAPPKPTSVQVTPNQSQALSYVRSQLLGRSSPDEIQGLIFESARKFNIEPTEFFRLLYQILLGTHRGPRLGPYIADIGVEKVSEMLEKHAV